VSVLYDYFEKRIQRNLGLLRSRPMGNIHIDHIEDGISVLQCPASTGKAGLIMGLVPRPN
jgi:hypothetical protein